jgi:uncharacterized protein (DUF4415 family)
MSENKHGIESTWVDPDDAPELDDAWFQRAELRVGDTVIRPGRPKAGVTKVSTTVRFDADIIDAFRADGPGWQTRMNLALRQWLNARTAA